MKKVSILKYFLKGVSVTKKTLIHRALYGYKDNSNKSNYTYNRKGILDRLEYKKISNAVILIETKDLAQIIPIFKRYKIKVSIMDMIML